MTAAVRVTDTGTLRADYEHARARIDRLTDALIDARKETSATVRAMLTAANPDAYRSGPP